MQKSQRRRHRGLPIFFSLLFNLVFFFGRLHRCRMYYNLGLRGCLMVGPPHKRTKKISLSMRSLTLKLKEVSIFCVILLVPNRFRRK